MIMQKKPTKSLLTTLLFCGTALSTGLVQTAFANDSNSTATTVQTSSISNRIIVKYKNQAPESKSLFMSRSSMSRASSVAGVEMGHMRQLATGAQLLTVDPQLTQAEVDTAIDNLNADPNVEYAERDVMLYPMATPNDPGYNRQWHYYEQTGGLNLPTAWDVNQGQGAVVAVLDTGFRPHADLQANLLPGYDMISSAQVSQDGNGRDADARDTGDWVLAGGCGNGQPLRDQNNSWHGTHVAGTVAASTNNGSGVAGVAYKAKVVPVRVLGRCGGFTSDIADGIIWAAGGTVAGVPTNQNPANVINLSLGGESNCTSTTQSAINQAVALNTTVVASAGNSNKDAGGFTPAGCSNVITVSATNRNGGKANYSNFGSVVEIAAPGGEGQGVNGVLSTLNNGQQSIGDDAFAYYSGTSMAAPHVAGAIALLYSVNNNITPAQVRNIIRTTARSFPQNCNQCGAGILDATAALNAASNLNKNSDSSD